MLRRRSQTSVDDSPVPIDDPKPQGKGRPTPKRRDAESRRRQPVTAPKDRKEAYRQSRAKQAAERERARKGMLAGDERYYPARDKGPARKFARDWVDSRRLPSQYFLPFSMLILLATWVPWPADIRPLILSSVITIGWPIMMVGVLFTSIYVAWRMKRLVAEKYPDESLRGVGFYAAMRALQIRKLRFPPPTVLPGGKPVPPKK
ncbi:DUF3043 domain-containing protein [Nonomuraea cavernae]|uniref:DUF3043 domain-containing protein n=1 Tax=Nonomuraea cavernae TaxID=2045107 RepID=A0A918DLB9_9ACTN|nr:DUF3043 domain-containing protein [Nonomuraea cavernae]MCA2188479.1 DUF3043 domain-containing protein [Nonomuraea cavernae]GGO73198.1 hypothetical protein GCM10012289_43030 [Nonomuraea cavernae]